MRILVWCEILYFIFNVSINSQVDYTNYVNPFIGTAGHGHTYPGASAPFGMMQLSPDTGLKDWDWVSGYNSSDSSIIGFSHTHLSGTGVADYGDILFMPFIGENKFKPGSKDKPDEGYRSRFSHQNEKASPGYYSVFLTDYDIYVELTTAQRSGMHKYQFQVDKSHKILIDLFHGLQDATLESYINIIGDNKVEGYRTSSGWAKKHTVYFYAEFSKNISKHIIELNEEILTANSAKGISVKSILEFEKSLPNELLVKIGISHVSLEGAKKNLLTEITDWDFTKIYNSTKKKWNDYLARIEIEGGTRDQKITFYTSLYHAFLAPNIFNDVDKKYIGMDGETKIAEDFNMYTIFSLWDTFRALHPLITIIDPDLATDFIKSILEKFKESGSLPIWELAGNETGTMIGYHSIPVIVDAYMKGIREFDIDTAYGAMVKSAMGKERGLEYYKTMGFIPMDKADDAVSTTLEYAYDDWCIATMAKELNKENDYQYFMSRAKNYLNVFDEKTKFMRGRFYSGFWKDPFDPIEPSYLGAGEFTEGNAWQYTWFVPHDIQGLIKAMGGDDLFKEKIDELFLTETDTSKYQMPSDVTGLIGQYAQGNEPSHHIVYLYNYCGFSWKTQEYTRKIMEEFFHSGRDGLCGNEDCGQMSAWYALSAMGFYPVLPGSNEYVIGSPIFDKVKINLTNGNTFRIIANNNSRENKYINSAKLSGINYSKTYFTHDDILNGSTIEFNMVKVPNKNFGAVSEERPNSRISENIKPIIYNKNYEPVITPYRSLFANSVTTELKTFSPDTEIRYTLDGTEPNNKSELYREPIILKASSILKAKTFDEYKLPSNTVVKNFTKKIVRDLADPFYMEGNSIFPVIIENNNFSPKYSGNGINGIIDGSFGTLNYHDSFWQGFQELDCEITIDFGRVTEIKKIGANFLNYQSRWIFLPKEVSVSFSQNGDSYSEPVIIFTDKIKLNKKKEIVTIEKDLTSIHTRYIKFFAENIGSIPSFHKSAGKKAWLFLDEIFFE
jgi:predicted alpha-1,2-mannosidase